MRPPHMVDLVDMLDIEIKDVARSFAGSEAPYFPGAIREDPR
jgi:hypothetical protein